MLFGRFKLQEVLQLFMFVIICKKYKCTILLRNKMGSSLLHASEGNTD